MSLIRYQPFRMQPIPPLIGNLKPNIKLTKASYIAFKKLSGPESIVFSSNGSMYAGLMNGQIVRIDHDGNIHKVAQIGPLTNENKCSKNSNKKDSRFTLINTIKSSVGVFKNKMT